jgi:hypothetical protein
MFIFLPRKIIRRSCRSSFELSVTPDNEGQESIMLVCCADRTKADIEEAMLKYQSARASQYASTICGQEKTLTVAAAETVL